MSKAWFCEECAHATHPECEFETITIGGILGGSCVLCGSTSKAYHCARLKPFDFSMALRFAKRGARVTRSGWVCFVKLHTHGRLAALAKTGVHFDPEFDWRPDGFDMLAEDWELYLEETKP